MESAAGHVEEGREELIKAVRYQVRNFHDYNELTFTRKSPSSSLLINSHPHSNFDSQHGFRNDIMLHKFT